MRHWLVTALLLSLPAQAQEQPPQDVVMDMQKQYYVHFKELPPSRKCQPEDAKGIWKEVMVYETGQPQRAGEHQKDGPTWLGFGGQYNTLLWKRTKEELNVGATLESLPHAKKQYIMTAAGMFYVYDNGVYETSYLCYVSTKGTNKFAEGLLMLALPVEKNKPLNMTLYSPIYLPAH